MHEHAMLVHTIVNPPLTLSVCPVINSAAGEVKKQHCFGDLFWLRRTAKRRGLGHRFDDFRGLFRLASDGLQQRGLRQAGAHDVDVDLIARHLARDGL